MSLRFVVTDVFVVQGNVIPVGTVESGVIKPGIRIRIEELGITATVKQFEMMQGGMNDAVAGDNTGFSLTNISGPLTKDMIKVGFIITEA